MSAKAEMKVDSTGHAMVHVEIDRSYGIKVVGELTSLEVEHFIKELRTAANQASTHNRNKTMRKP